MRFCQCFMILLRSRNLFTTVLTTCNCKTATGPSTQQKNKSSQTDVYIQSCFVLAETKMATGLLKILCSLLCLPPAMKTNVLLWQPRWFVVIGRLLLEFLQVCVLQLTSNSLQCFVSNIVQSNKKNIFIKC